MGDYVIRASEMRIFRVYIYIKVYGGSRCERVEEREGVGVGVRGVTSRM